MGWGLREGVGSTPGVTPAVQQNLHSTPVTNLVEIQLFKDKTVSKEVVRKI